MRQDTESDSLLSSPKTRETDKCILVCLFINFILRKSGLTVVAELKLPLSAHRFAVVLLTLVVMCSKGFISGTEYGDGRHTPPNRGC